MKTEKNSKKSLEKLDALAEQKIDGNHIKGGAFSGITVMPWLGGGGGGGGFSGNGGGGG